MSCRRELPATGYAQQTPQPAPPAPTISSAGAITLRCKVCKSSFTVEPKAHPFKLKCPNCGAEGMIYPPRQGIVVAGAGEGKCAESMIYPPRPKRRAGLIISVIAVVIILILGIVLADYFVVKKIIFKGGEKGEEERQIAGTVTAQQLADDFNESTMSFETYKPGTAVYIEDTVADVQAAETSYGIFTTILFNITSHGDNTTMPVVVEGNKTTEYNVGSTVTIYTPIDEYTIGGQKVVLWEGGAMFCVLVLQINFFGDGLVKNFTTGGDVKLVVAASYSGELSEYSAVLSKVVYADKVFGRNTTETAVDSITDLSSCLTSSGGHITFTDANSNSELDSGDYFIISMGTTNSKYVWDIYELTLKQNGSNKTSEDLGLGYKGFFYTEESYITITTGGGTSYCTLSASTSGTGTGQSQVNITWMVSAPSRADIKWSDIPQASAKVFDDGVVITSPTFAVWPSGTYVTGGDIIRVTLNRSSVASGSIIKLILVYAPSGGTLAESSVTVSYTV